MRTNPKVRGGFVRQAAITRSQQEKYMRKHGDCYWVCLHRGKFAGYIGVIDNDIRVAVKPEYQKRGVGLFMVKRIRQKFPEASAKIKLENVPSRKLFLKAGYKIKYFLLEP